MRILLLQCLALSVEAEALPGIEYLMSVTDEAKKRDHVEVIEAWAFDLQCENYYIERPKFI